ncbi:MAG: amidohydrolase [Bacillota bacterium]|nr:amidohydrolase [Bacillota bacterium]
MQDIVSLRRDFHKIAETGWLEIQTTIKVIGHLLDLGFEVKYGKEVHTERIGVPKQAVYDAYLNTISLPQVSFDISEIIQGYTGCVGVFDTGKPGPTVAIRSDIDAVGLRESDSINHLANIEGFRSTNDFAMHACGHDGHMAITLKTCQRIVDEKDKLKGKYVVVFQPAEEGVRGGLSMSKLDIIGEVDYLLGGHIGMGMETGTIGVGTDNFLGTKKFDISLKGRAAHAGMAPDQGRSAILGAAALTLGLHSLSQYRATSRINVGQISGGTGRNVVAPNAELLLEIRADDNEILEDLDSRVRIMSKSTAQAYELEEEIVLAGAAEMFSTRHPEFVKETTDYLRAKGYKVFEKPSLNASEDISFYLNRVEKNAGRVMHFLFGSNLKAAHHNESFDFDESILPIAVNLYMDMIYKFNNH